MSEEELQRWRHGSDTTAHAIAAARASGDWDRLDVIAQLLGIDGSPESSGAWETLCEALCRPTASR